MGVGTVGSNGMSDMLGGLDLKSMMLLKKKKGRGQNIGQVSGDDAGYEIMDGASDSLALSNQNASGTGAVDNSDPSSISNLSKNPVATSLLAKAAATSSSVMSGNFAGADSEESKYLRAVHIKNDTESSIQNEMDSLAANLSAGTEGDNQYIAATKMAARAKRVMKRAADEKVIKEAKKTHLKESIADIQNQTEEAMAPEAAAAADGTTGAIGTSGTTGAAEGVASHASNTAGAVSEHSPVDSPVDSPELSPVEGTPAPAMTAAIAAKLPVSLTV